MASTNNLRTIDLYVFATQSDKGLIARFNSDGSPTTPKIRGKIFFPDRSCEERIKPGLVHVTSVKEFNTYGFFTGEMAKISVPTDEDLANYLASRWVVADKIYYYRNEAGDYATISDRALFRVEGVLKSASLKEMNSDTDILIREKNVGDFLCKYHGHGESIDDLVKGFTKVPLKKGNLKESGYVSPCVAFESARDSGSISVRDVRGINVAFLEAQLLRGMLIQNAPEEVEAIVQEFNDINNKALQRFRSMKLSLSQLESL